MNHMTKDECESLRTDILNVTHLLLSCVDWHFLNGRSYTYAKAKVCEELGTYTLGLKQELNSIDDKHSYND